MAVVGERVERDIADDAEVRAGILDRAHGPADEVVRVAGQGAVIVLQRRVNRRKTAMAGMPRRTASRACVTSRSML